MIASVRNHHRHHHPRRRIVRLKCLYCHRKRKIYPNPIMKSSSSLASNTRMRFSKRTVARKRQVHQTRSSNARSAVPTIPGSHVRNAHSRFFAPHVMICFTSIPRGVRTCERPLNRTVHRYRRKFYPDKMDQHHRWRHQDARHADLHHFCRARNRSIQIRCQYRLRRHPQ